MVLSGNILPRSGEGSRSDFFCLSLLNSERRQLGVYVGREGEECEMGRWVTLRVVFWSSSWCCLNAVLAFMAGVCNWSHSPNLVITQFILWPIRSHLGTSWLQNPEIPCQPPRPTLRSAPHLLGNWWWFRKANPRRFWLPNNTTQPKGWRCVRCWKS